MTLKRVYPIRGRVYTYEEISNLFLEDSPSLSFYTSENHLTCIQDSHVTEEETLSIPGFKDTRWRYIYTTDEWIPVFRLDQENGDQDINSFVTTVETGDDFQRFWTTFKAYPRNFNE